MALGYDGSIRIDTSINSKGFNKGINAMMGSLRGLAAAIGIAFGVGAVVNFGKSAVDAASDMASAMIGLQSVVTGTGGDFKKAQAFINDYIKDGLVPAMNAMTAYKNLAMRGYDTSQIEKVMVALKDSASFGRQASLSLGDAVQSATEGLKNENSILVDNAGVTKNVSVMWKDYAASIGTTADKLTKQQKIQAEVNGILQEARFQTGDAAKLSNTYAGQISALGVSLLNLKVAVGNTIIPIISQILPYIKMAVDALVVFFNQAAQVINLFFGTNVSMASAEMGDLAGSTLNVSEAQDQLADSTNAAKKAAKGALAAFDELNVLQMEEPTEKGAESIAPIKISVDTGVMDEGLSELKDKVETFKAKLAELFGPTLEGLGKVWKALQPFKDFVAKGAMDFFEYFLKPVGKWILGEGLPIFLNITAKGLQQINWDKINKALAELWKALTPFAINIGEGLLWFYEKVLMPIGVWLANAVAPASLDILTGAIKVLNSAMEALAPHLEPFYEKFLKPIGEWVGDQIVDYLNNIADGLDMLAKWIDEHPDEFAGYFLSLVSPLILVVENIDKFKPSLEAAWNALVANWGNAGPWFSENVTEPLKKWFGEAWDTVKLWASNAWDNVKKTWNSVGTWFKENVTDPASKTFDETWKSIEKFAKDSWKNIQDKWTGAKKWFEDTVTNPIKDAFNIALIWIENTWKRTFDGVKDFVKGTINSIIGFLNSMIRGINDGVNSAIDAINAIRIDIPGWVPGIGGNSWSVNIQRMKASQIPYLATGAVIPPNAQFAAILGDQRNGRNLEAPEGLIRQIIQEEIANIKADITIDFKGSLAGLVRELKPYIDKENVRIGNSLIRSGVVR